jgi:hypothetical protein
MTAPRNAMGTLLVNLGAFAAFWLLLFVTVRVSDGLAGREAVMMMATAAAVALAAWLRARVVALFLAAMLAFNLAELLAHSIWGQHAVQGGPTHFAVMGAGVFGVIFGLAVQRYLGSRTA